MLISGSNIPVPQTSTHIRQSFIVLTRSTRRPSAFGIELKTSCETHELLIFFVNLGACRTTNSIFEKKTFLYGDMLSFNILTISALLLYVSCGLASKKEVNIFFISQISCKKHFSNRVTFLTELVYIEKLISELNHLIGKLSLGQRNCRDCFIMSTNKRRVGKSGRKEKLRKHHSPLS